MSMQSVEMIDVTQATDGLLVGSRPMVVNAEQHVLVRTPRGLMVNSLLRENEWKEVDMAALAAARYPLRVVSGLRRRGLVRRLGGLGTLVSQWYMRSEVTPAHVSMTGQGALRDLPDLRTAGVPVPVISKEFAIDARSLEASRRLGDGLDVSAAEEAARVVAEAYDDLVLNGNTTIVTSGMSVYGLRSHPNRNTDTAASFGGGVWSASTDNPVKTVAGMINAAMTDRHYGPYMVYVGQKQYNDAALTFYSDGTAQTPMQRIESLPQVEGVEMLPNLPDGEVLLVQMTSDVVRLAEALDLQVREWTSPDGMTSVFRVMLVGTVEVKARYDGKSGIVHATGA